MENSFKIVCGNPECNNIIELTDNSSWIDLGSAFNENSQKIIGIEPLMDESITIYCKCGNAIKVRP